MGTRATAGAEAAARAGTESGLGLRLGLQLRWARSWRRGAPQLCTGDGLRSLRLHRSYFGSRYTLGCYGMRPGARAPGRGAASRLTEEGALARPALAVAPGWSPAPGVLPSPFSL